MFCTVLSEMPGLMCEVCCANGRKKKRQRLTVQVAHITAMDLNVGHTHVVIRVGTAVFAVAFCK